MPSETYYDILEVKQDAPVEEIREAFYRLAYKYHPENNTKRAEEAAKNFQKVIKTHAALSSLLILSL